MNSVRLNVTVSRGNDLFDDNSCTKLKDGFLISKVIELSSLNMQSTMQ